MTTIDDLEQRLIELEQRLGPVPLAANPPVTIGELADVPAPGSAIASPWAQEVTRRIQHRFATVAARDAAYPAAGAGAGALCVTLDTGTVWVVVGAAWIPVSPRVSAYFNTGGAGNTNAGVESGVTSLNVPAQANAGRMQIFADCYVIKTVPSDVFYFRVKMDGVLIVVSQADTGNSAVCHFQVAKQVTIPTIAARTIQSFLIRAAGTGTASWQADPNVNQVSALTVL